MGVYKDKERGTWYVKTYYTNWQGQKKQKLKRGFKLQREAKEWERKFLEQFAKNPDITFESLYEKYKEFITPRIKESTAYVRFHTLDQHVLPYFKDKIISEITPADIAAWQNEMLKKGLSNTYMNNINSCLKFIFKYAVDYVGLPQSPCRDMIGSRKTKKIDFWTPEEYKKFSATCSDSIEHFTIFEILFYTGMRVGELLALTLNDIDFKNNTISINKTFYHIAGKDLINTPKTESSDRVIDIPAFLSDEIREYVSHLYKPDPCDRLFQKSPFYIRNAIKRGADEAGVKQIRVHDLRHSHASMLINLGANPLLVAERLGHENPNITMKTYAHLFPKTQSDIVSKIQKIK